jgi:hypothetical protein
VAERVIQTLKVELLWTRVPRPPLKG